MIAIPSSYGAAARYEGQGGFMDNLILCSQVDCDREPTLCVEFEIRAYPTVKWFPSSMVEAEK